MRLKEIAQFLNGELIGDPDVIIKGVAKIEEARAGDLTFLSNPKYLKYLETTKASAILIGLNLPAVAIPHIKLADPYVGFLNILNKIYPREKPKFNGIHSSAILSANIKLGENVTIAPLVYIGENVELRQEYRSLSRLCDFTWCEDRQRFDSLS